MFLFDQSSDKKTTLWGTPEQVPRVKNLGISFWVFQISALILKLIRDSLLQRWWIFMNIGIQNVENVIFWDECIYFNSTTKSDLKIGFRIENNCESSQILGSENLNHRMAPRDKKITANVNRCEMMINMLTPILVMFGPLQTSLEIFETLFKKIC